MNRPGEVRLAMVGTCDGRCLAVDATPAGHVLLGDGLAVNRANTLNAAQSRELGQALVRAADVIEGIAGVAD
jgi:hypothetical protein